MGELSQLHVFLCSGFAMWPLVLPAFFLFEKTPAELQGELQTNLTADNGNAVNPSVANEEAWKSQRLLGVKRKWLVPIVVETSGLITAIGAGMTIKFFPLFFKEDYEFKPIALNALSAGYTVSIALFVQLCLKVSKRIGRCQAAFAWQTCGIIALFGLWKAQPLVLVIFLHIIRGSFMNACSPINSAIIMDCVDSKYRGRWSAIQSLSRVTWSGSAILGGWLADSHDYRYTFLITAIIYSVAAVLYLPLLFLVPREQAQIGNPNSEPASDAAAPLQAEGDVRDKDLTISLQPVDGSTTASSLGEEEGSVI